jgi:ATP synthase protein I
VSDKHLPSAETESESDAHDGMLASVRRARQRRQNEAEPSVIRFVGQIGVLGWVIVTPALIGLFLGRWIDNRIGSGIFWSAPLLLIGVAIGCWSAWRWMHRQ